MKGLAAVLIGGPPATGKTTLATALAPHLGAAVLDLDPPAVPHLAPDASQPTPTLVSSVLTRLSR